MLHFLFETWLTTRKKKQDIRM